MNPTIELTGTKLGDVYTTAKNELASLGYANPDTKEVGGYINENNLLQTPTILSSTKGQDIIEGELQQHNTEVQQAQERAKSTKSGQDTKDEETASSAGYTLEELKSLGLDPNTMEYDKETDTYKPATISPAEKALTRQIDQDTKEIDDTFKAQEKYIDSATESLLGQIRGIYSARATAQIQANKRSQERLQNYGLRIGASRYTGGAFQGILNANEREGLKRLDAIALEEAGLISQAEQARMEKKYTLFSEKRDELKSLRDERMKVLADLQKTAQEEQNKAKERERLVLLDDAVASLLDQDITDPNQVFGEIRKAGGNYTSKEIKDSLTNLSGGQATDLGVDMRMFDYAKQQGWLSEDATIFDFWRLKGDSQREPKDPTASGLSSKVVTQIDNVSKSFDSSPIVKQYNETVNKYLTIKGIVESGTISGAGDLALVFEFMKALDPTSVVRESEYDTASKAGNPFKRVAAKMGGYVTKGQILPQDVRDEFKRLSEMKLNVVQTQYNNLRDEKARLINKKTGDVDGADYLIDYSGALDFVQNLEQQNQETANEVKRLYTTYPTLKPAVEKMLTDGLDWSTILQVITE